MVYLKLNGAFVQFSKSSKNKEKIINNKEIIK